MTHVWAEKCVTPGKIALNFPEVTQLWETCVTQGMSPNLTDIPWVTHFPLMTQFFSVKKCVTQGMSTVLYFYCPKLFYWGKICSKFKREFNVQLSTFFEHIFYKDEETSKIWWNLCFTMLNGTGRECDKIYLTLPWWHNFEASYCPPSSWLLRKKLGNILLNILNTENIWVIELSKSIIE